MRVLKKIVIAILIVIGFLLATCEPEDPYYSNIYNIPSKVYAKGKPKKVKKKTLKQDYEYLGKYVLTAYCGCPKCCGRVGAKTATGTVPKSNHTIAVDPKVIPYESKIVINKIEYTAEDCGGGIKGKHIDIYFDSHSEATDFGKQRAKVYLKKPPVLLSKLRRYRNARIKRIIT